MSDRTDFLPANENVDPLSDPDAARAELHRIRREILAEHGTERPLWWWRDRRWLLEQVALLERQLHDELR